MTNWFAKLNVVEIQVDATDLHKGDRLLFIGHKTGMLEVTADDLRVDYEPADVARQGIRCSVAIPPEVQPAQATMVVRSLQFFHLTLQ